MAVHRERMLYGRRNNKHIYSLPVKAKGFYKMFRCKARKNLNREAYISYVERRGLQRNAADGHFQTTPATAFQTLELPPEA